MESPRHNLKQQLQIETLILFQWNDLLIFLFIHAESLLMSLFSKDLESSLHSQGEKVEVGDSAIISLTKRKKNINLGEMGE